MACIQPLVDMTQCPEQSSFIAGCSTIDAILALCLLSDIHRESNRLLNMAYLDIKAAFDSINRQTLWKALSSRGMPDAFLKLIASLHENTSAQVRLDQNLSNHLQMITSARQNCVLAPVLFSIAIDWILCHMTVKPRIAVGHDHFGDLVYADDTVFFVKSTAEAVSSPVSYTHLTLPTNREV